MVTSSCLSSDTTTYYASHAPHHTHPNITHTPHPPPPQYHTQSHTPISHTITLTPTPTHTCLTQPMQPWQQQSPLVPVTQVPSEIDALIPHTPMPTQSQMVCLHHALGAYCGGGGVGGELGESCGWRGGVLYVYQRVCETVNCSEEETACGRICATYTSRTHAYTYIYKCTINNTFAHYCTQHYPHIHTYTNTHKHKRDTQKRHTNAPTPTYILHTSTSPSLHVRSCIFSRSISVRAV